MPPPGPPPTPPSPELIAYSNARHLVTETSILCGFAALAVLVRCYVRVVMLKAFGHDDWTMVLALVRHSMYIDIFYTNDLLL